MTTTSPSRKVDIKTLRLMINIIRRAESDYLDPKIGKKTRKTAEATLFGIRESPLPEVCEAMGIDLVVARLLLVKWKMEGRVGDPIFGWMKDPNALLKVSKGIPLNIPNFESLRSKDARTYTGKPEGSIKRTKQNRPPHKKDS